MRRLPVNLSDTDRPRRADATRVWCTRRQRLLPWPLWCDDSTLLTPGSGPACEAVTQEVSLFVLAAHRPSGVARRWRALVRDVCGGDGERSREATVKHRRKLRRDSDTQGYTSLYSWHHRSKLRIHSPTHLFHLYNFQQKVVKINLFFFFPMKGGYFKEESHLFLFRITL